jgi:hypothetical protein
MRWYYNRGMRHCMNAVTRLCAITAVVLLLISCGRYLERSLGSPSIDGDTVTFRVKVPSARTVQLAGDWPRNNWARGDAEEGEVLVGLMGKTADTGVWEPAATAIDFSSMRPSGFSIRKIRGSSTMEEEGRRIC